MPSVTLRSPDELADALPYFMGFHPSDSLVLVALQGDRGLFAGRVRLGIPEAEEDWEFIGRELPRCLVQEVERRTGGTPPDGVVAYLCREPGPGDSGRQVMEGLRPLADALLASCRDLGLRVLEALCLSGGRFWSYVCTGAGEACCPPDGRPMLMPGTSVMAASATFAGIQVRGTQQEMEARLTPPAGASAAAQEEAIDDAVAEALPRLLDEERRLGLAADTLVTIGDLVARLRENPPPAARARSADEWDDRLLTDAEAARVLVGLQDLQTRDRATLWMEGSQAAAALRLWRALARRCAGVYRPYGGAVRTLAGWAAWSLGDVTEARLSLEMALTVDPDCVLAEMLYQAAGSGMALERMREALRSGVAEYPALRLPARVWPPVDVPDGGTDAVQGELFALRDVGEGVGAGPAAEGERRAESAVDRSEPGEPAPGAAQPGEEAVGPVTDAASGSSPSAVSGRGTGAWAVGRPGPRGGRPTGRAGDDGRPKPRPAKAVPRQRRRSPGEAPEVGERGAGGEA
ncbi:protein of unknown function [Streptomyces indicus]|uniref:DUF4192 domain-containing protein n=2 Tax=Streptomyces indicus TaxID=417292 RepID=A0A1G9B033_9ACTN|nr:protein of unknown function [Streptomyces indicus]